MVAAVAAEQDRRCGVDSWAGKMKMAAKYSIRVEKDGANVTARYDLSVDMDTTELLASFDLNVEGKNLIDIFCRRKPLRERSLHPGEAFGGRGGDVCDHNERAVEYGWQRYAARREAV
jgi:hypothetical protein